MTARRGFTAIELIVVLVILAVGTGLAVPAFRSWFQEDDLTVATHRIEALFQVARDSAIRSGLPVTVVIDSATGRVWLDVPMRDDEDTVAVEADVGYFDAVRDDRAAPLPSATERASSLRSAMTGVAGADFAGGESLALPSTVRLELTRARARFTIAPGGNAFADTLLLRTTMAERRVTLDPWTADVRVY